MPAGSGSGSGRLDLRFCYVDSVQLARFDRFREPQRYGPGSAAEVEDAHAGLEARKQVRCVGIRASAI
jgi:hypothetical protein